MWRNALLFFMLWRCCPDWHGLCIINADATTPNTKASGRAHARERSTNHATWRWNWPHGRRPRHRTRNGRGYGRRRPGPPGRFRPGHRRELCLSEMRQDHAASTGDTVQRAEMPGLRRAHDPRPLSGDSEENRRRGRTKSCEAMNAVAVVRLGASVDTAGKARRLSPPCYVQACPRQNHAAVRECAGGASSGNRFWKLREIES